MSERLFDRLPDKEDSFEERVRILGIKTKGTAKSKNTNVKSNDHNWYQLNK